MSGLWNGETVNDPNDTYKAGFRELTELLGRVPVTTDAGWLQLQEEYKKSWQPAEETVFAPRVKETDGNEPSNRTRGINNPSSLQSRGVRQGPSIGLQNTPTTGMRESNSAAGPVNNGFSREPAPQASGVGEEAGAREGQGATGGSGANGEGERAGSAGGWGTGALRDCDRPIRGASGGVLAVCEGCGQEWERERRRGRPAKMCGECR